MAIPVRGGTAQDSLARQERLDSLDFDTGAVSNASARGESE
jgi:hypothetical protein